MVAEARPATPPTTQTAYNNNDNNINDDVDGDNDYDDDDGGDDVHNTRTRAPTTASARDRGQSSFAYVKKETASCPS